MNKPVIGIVGKPALNKDMWSYIEIVDNIRYNIIKNDGLAMGILPPDNTLDFKLDEEEDTKTLSQQEFEDMSEILNRLDCVIFQGGLVSNQYEIEMAKYCIKNNIPVLGICAGFNVIVRALGGKVHIDDSIFHNQYGMKIAHYIDVNKDCVLYKILKKEKVIVNSIHTCIASINEVKNCYIGAVCPDDNNVEEIENMENGFIMGIKWHPELMESDEMNSIFTYFIKECSK